MIRKLVFSSLLLIGNAQAITTNQIKNSSLVKYGIEFNCNSDELKSIKESFNNLSKELEVSDFVRFEEDKTKLRLFLSKQYTGGSNLHIHTNPVFKLEKEKVKIPTNNGEQVVSVVSRKEILLSLLYPGRLTKFENKQACQADSLKEHIELRQNIVLWGQKLAWIWPDGEPAYWNKKYWNKGTPILNDSNQVDDLVVATRDLFLNQNLYAIGCYTASKAVYLQAVLDYYARVRPNREKLDSIVKTLMVDREPLVDIEPQAMWYFEKDNKKKHLRSGKILAMVENVYPSNFVPGDWSYFRNTDNKTNQKIGYEGSNAIYLGENVFDDYYKDHEHGYPYERKLDEVYQWRNGVFSRSRDEEKIKPLTAKQRFKLTLPPKEGGLVESYRVVPIIF